MLSHEAHPSKPLSYKGEVVIEHGYRVVWFLYKGQPYDIGRFYRPDGTWTGYYVDILEPVHWDGDDPHTIAPLVDLDLDLWIAPDASYQILDEDEFRESERAGHLTPTQVAQARAALAQVLSAIQNAAFPPYLVREYVRATG